MNLIEPHTLHSIQLLLKLIFEFLILPTLIILLVICANKAGSLLKPKVNKGYYFTKTVVKKPSKKINSSQILQKKVDSTYGYPGLMTKVTLSFDSKEQVIESARNQNTDTGSKGENDESFITSNDSISQDDQVRQEEIVQKKEQEHIFGGGEFHEDLSQDPAIGVHPSNEKFQFQQLDKHQTPFDQSLLHTNQILHPNVKNQLANALSPDDKKSILEIHAPPVLFQQNPQIQSIYQNPNQQTLLHPQIQLPSILAPLVPYQPEITRVELVQPEKAPEKPVAEKALPVSYSMLSESLLKKSSIYASNLQNFRSFYKTNDHELNIIKKNVIEIVKGCDISSIFKVLMLKDRFVGLARSRNNLWETYFQAFIIEVETLFTTGDFAGDKYNLSQKRELVNYLAIFVLTADAELGELPFLDYVLCYILNTVPLLKPHLENEDYTKKNVETYWKKVFLIDKKAEYFKCLCFFYFTLLTMNPGFIFRKLLQMLSNQESIQGESQESGNQFITVEKKRMILEKHAHWRYSNSSIFWDFISKFFKLPVCFFSIFVVIELLKSVQVVEDSNRRIMQRTFEKVRSSIIPKYRSFSNGFKQSGFEKWIKGLENGLKEMEELTDKILRDTWEKLPFSAK